MGIVILVVIVALGIYAIYRFVINPKLPAIDYSFGKGDLKNGTTWYKACKYSEVESLIKQMTSDDLTQFCDCIALTLNEKELLKYHEIASDKSFSNLVLGVYYGHMAWRARGREYSEGVSNQQANSFLNLIEKSRGYLELAANHATLSAEVNARLVRVYMGLNEDELVRTAFKNSISRDSNKLWAYIHFSEAIQPKWGGSIEEIHSFYNALPDNEIIRTTIKLKLINDGLIESTNYFDSELTGSEIFNYATKYIKELDSSNSLYRIPSIHKYVIYGYMFSLGSILEEKLIKDKYWKLLENRLPLYPFGLQ